MFIRENKVIMQKDTVCSINYCIYADQKFPDTAFFLVFSRILLNQEDFSFGIHVSSSPVQQCVENYLW